MLLQTLGVVGRSHGTGKENEEGENRNESTTDMGVG